MYSRSSLIIFYLLIGLFGSLKLMTIILALEYLIKYLYWIK